MENMPGKQFEVRARVYKYYYLPKGPKGGKRKIITDDSQDVEYICSATCKENAEYQFHEVYGYGSLIRDLHTRELPMIGQMSIA
jgi:hypothetical protein